MNCWRSKPYGLKNKANDITWDGKCEYFVPVVNKKKRKISCQKRN